MEDKKRVDDEEDISFTVLAEWETRKVSDVQGHVWAFNGSLTVPPRKTSNCDLLQMTMDVFSAVAERWTSRMASSIVSHMSSYY